jgi:Winged helix DNA-binding domain
MLLRRWDLPVTEAVERLAGLNAQDPEPPYFGLWARLAGFELDDLTRRLEDRTVVRSTLLRGTQHLVTAADYLAWRPLLQPMLERRQRAGFGRATEGVEPAALVAAARELLAQGPLTRPELGRRLAARWPGRDPGALASSVQYLLPLIHPPPSGTWRHRGAIPCVLAETWLGRPLPAAASPAGMIRRHLAAFGPASVMDVQAWSGLTRQPPPRPRRPHPRHHRRAPPARLRRRGGRADRPGGRRRRRHLADRPGGRHRHRRGRAARWADRRRPRRALPHRGWRLMPLPARLAPFSVQLTRTTRM